MRRLITASLLALSLAALGCDPVDNSGGPPPDGDKLEWERVSFLSIGCQRYGDAARLITDQPGLDTYLDGCSALSNEEQATVDGALADLGDDDVLLGLDFLLGGCIGETAFMGAYKEGSTLHAWYLKGNSAYGVENAACTADIGESHEMVRVLGAGDVEEVDVKVGEFNPDLPNPPALPGG